MLSQLQFTDTLRARTITNSHAQDEGARDAQAPRIAPILHRVSTNDDYQMRHLPSLTLTPPAPLEPSPIYFAPFPGHNFRCIPIFGETELEMMTRIQKSENLEAAAVPGVPETMTRIENIDEAVEPGVPENLNEAAEHGVLENVNQAAELGVPAGAALEPGPEATAPARQDKFYARLIAVSGVVSPMKFGPTIGDNQHPLTGVPAGSRLCAICRNSFRKNDHVKSHFVSCVEKNGNPHGARWEDGIDKSLLSRSTINRLQPDGQGRNGEEDYFAQLRQTREARRRL